MDKAIPEIEIKDNVLTISLSLDELILITENRGDGYKVLKPDKFIKAFKFQLENFATSNAIEKGISELQDLFDDIMDEIYINDNDKILKEQ